MRTLSQPIYTLLARAINTHGTYDPAVISYLFEEDLTAKQYAAVIPFLQWCHTTGLLFGRGNYTERYTQYLASRNF